MSAAESAAISLLSVKYIFPIELIRWLIMAKNVSFFGFYVESRMINCLISFIRLDEYHHTVSYGWNFYHQCCKKYLLLQSQFSIAVSTKEDHRKYCNTPDVGKLHYFQFLVSTATLLQSSVPGPPKGSIFVINCGATYTLSLLCTFLECQEILTLSELRGGLTNKCVHDFILNTHPKGLGRPMSK